MTGIPRAANGHSPGGAGSFTRMCSSASCAAPAGAGASVSGHQADWVFGTAITSRLLSAPLISMAGQPEGDTAVRWGPVAQRLEQETERLTGLAGLDAQQFEHRALQVLAVDADRATADLGAVQHQVVGTREPGARIGDERGGIGIHRRRERMVHRRPAPLPRIPLEHREIDDPQRPPADRDDAEVAAELQAQRAERIVDGARLVRAEEDQVAVRSCVRPRMPAMAASLRTRIGDCKPRPAFVH